MQNKNIKIVIADDHQIVIDGIKAMLESEQDINVIGEAQDGKALMDLLEILEPDIVLVDINMPHMDGVEVTRRVNSKFKDLKVLILSTYDDVRLIKEILKLGAKGYVLKTADKTELIKAIRTLYEGGTFFSQEISDKILKSMIPSETVSESTNSLPPVALTKREMEIIKLIAMEYSGPEISKKLFISINTVETHRKNLIRKTKSKNTIGLVKYAMKHDLI
ncbi:MAG: response regulator transcription factor [Chitinophagales bacterium]|nr:response regulator transcription factor [Chitinophagales bacterium]